MLDDEISINIISEKEKSALTKVAFAKITLLPGLSVSATVADIHFGGAEA